MVDSIIIVIEFIYSGLNYKFRGVSDATMIDGEFTFKQSN